MIIEGRLSAGLTPKGRRTRARIVEAAVTVIYERGVAATTIEDVKAVAGVSSSQLYHYFADRETLIQAVVDHQADALVGNQDRADFGSLEGVRAWRDFVVANARHTHGQGGCPLGSLGSQLAETDTQARARVATGFGRWSAAIGDGLRTLQANGHLSLDTDPDALAATLLAVLQGGLLLTQVTRDPGPLETALDTFLALAVRRPPSNDRASAKAVSRQ